MTKIVYEGGEHLLKGDDYYRIKENTIEVYLYSRNKSYKHTFSNVKYIEEELGTTKRAKKHPKPEEARILPAK